MGTSQKTVREFALIGFVLLAVLFGMQIMVFIFGNLDASVVIADTSTNIINESITPSGGIGTITYASNVNFVSWNATRIINWTVGESAPGNNTLVEGTDYQIFSANGSYGVITDFNDTRVTYDLVRSPEAKLVSAETTNQSLRAIGNYSEQSGTQFTTLGVAITLVLLVAVFLFFWKSFMGGKGKGKSSPGTFS